MIDTIIQIPLNDDISFSVKGINDIREGDEYAGLRVMLTADYPPMSVPLKLDITTGDKITPHEVEYSYKLMMENRSISVMAYNLSTILAEKLETVISRGDQNTRPRDYYDIYILTKLQSKNIDIEVLKTALFSTAEKRGSLALMKQYSEIISTIKNSKAMNQQWENYRKDFEYASSIKFSETCNSILQIMNEIYI